MDICHHKNAESEPKFQKYKGRVVLRGDTVKHDSGAHTVFIEQDSSASHMIAAKKRMSLQDYQVVTDVQLTPHQHTLR